MTTRALADNATVSGLVTISTISNANTNALVLTLSEGPFTRPKAVVKWKNTGTGTCGLSLRDVMSGASYFALNISAQASSMTSFDRGSGEVQLNISNVSGTIAVSAWLDD